MDGLVVPLERDSTAPASPVPPGDLCFPSKRLERVDVRPWPRVRHRAQDPPAKANQLAGRAHAQEPLQSRLAVRRQLPSCRRCAIIRRCPLHRLPQNAIWRPPCVQHGYGRHGGGPSTEGGCDGGGGVEGHGAAAASMQFPCLRCRPRGGMEVAWTWLEVAWTRHGVARQRHRAGKEVAWPGHRGGKEAARKWHGGGTEAAGQWHGGGSGTVAWQRRRGGKEVAWRWHGHGGARAARRGRK